MNKSYLARSHWPEVVLHIGFAVLAVLAFHLHRERLYLDSAYYLFYTINDGWFRVEHQRFVLAFSELPVLITSWLPIGMKPLMVVWSLTHVLWPWLAAWWLNARCKRMDLAVALLLLQVVGLRELYFSPMMEICYGGILSLLLVGLAARDEGLHQRSSLAAWCACSLLLITSHPEHVITYLVIGTLFLPWTTGLKRSLALLLLPTAIWAALKLVFLSEYEAGRLAAVASPMAQSGDLFGNALKAVHAWIQLVPETLALLLIVGVISWRSKTLLRFGVAIIGALLVLFAVSLARPIDGVDRDLESAFFPITVIVFVGASQVWSVSHGSALHRPVMAISACLFCLRIWTISTASNTFTARVNAIQTICDQALAADQQKVIVPFERTLPLYPWEWSAPMESLLISAAEKPRCVSVITTEDLVAVPALGDLREDQVVLRRWAVVSGNELRGVFQSLGTSHYCSIPSELNQPRFPKALPTPDLE